jgi:hypothetical protein
MHICRLREDELARWKAELSRFQLILAPRGQGSLLCSPRSNATPGFSAKSSRFQEGFSTSEDAMGKAYSREALSPLPLTQPEPDFNI